MRSIKSVKQLIFLTLISVSNVCFAYQYYEERGEEILKISNQIALPSNQKVFVFSPRHFAWAAFDEDGDIIAMGAASGGKSYCPDTGRPCRTATGSYRVVVMRGAECVSSIFPLATHEREAGGAPMPYCMFFKGGFAVHGSHNVPKSNASHGCVRVTPEAAQWLYENFIEIGTRVIVLPYYDG